MSDEPICRRFLEYVLDNDKTNVTIQVWRPVPDPQHPDDLFWCRFEVVGLPERIEGNAAGIDTMQALVCALKGIRMKLRPFAAQLLFLDSPYEDLDEISIGWIDPGRRRRVLEILEEEEYSLQVLMERRKDDRRVRVLRAQGSRTPDGSG
jgi:hypothetical protein